MRSNITIIHLRRLAAKRQANRCYYCNRIMGKTPQMRCTAEHLVARGDRGKDSKANIVAACKFCNSMRHRSFAHLAVADYRRVVRQQVDCKHWHEQHKAWRSLG